MWAATVPRIAELAASFGPARTVVTRFVADPSLGGSWVPYYRDWPFALVPDSDPLYAVVPELADVAGHVVTAGTFGKWPVLRDLVGTDAHLTLTGVSTDCCVLSTALPAADAGATVRVVRCRVRRLDAREPRAGPGGDGPLRPPDHADLTLGPGRTLLRHWSEEAGEGQDDRAGTAPRAARRRRPPPPAASRLPGLEHRGGRPTHAPADEQRGCGVGEHPEDVERQRPAEGLSTAKAATASQPTSTRAPR